MTVKFYNFTGEIKEVDKSAHLSNETIVNTIRMDGKQSIKKPIFFYESVTKPTFNYCYIQEFNTYYFLDEPDWYADGVWHMYASRDPLYTCKNYIYSLKVVVSRREQKGRSLFRDDRLVSKVASEAMFDYRELSPLNQNKRFNSQDNSISADNIILTAFMASTGVEEFIESLICTIPYANPDTEFSPSTYSYTLSNTTDSTISFTTVTTVNGIANIYQVANVYFYVNGVKYDSNLVSSWGNRVWENASSLPLTVGTNTVIVEYVRNNGAKARYTFTVERT